jgi:quercetin dioxygenase-like cupin family protein
MATRMAAKAMLRKARDHRIEMPHQPGQAHRSAAGWTIDYRLQAVTGGAVRAISTVAGHFVDKPAFGSPWHFHDCDLQVAIVLEGSIELGYLADTYARAVKGDVLFIPGHVLHDVSAPSADYQVAEITFPGTFGTTEAAMPAPGQPTAAVTLSPSDAVRAQSTAGVIDYVYPVGAAYRDQFALHRQLRSRVEDFEPGEQVHDEPYRMTFVTQGWREVALDGAAQRAEAGDLLVVPAGAVYRDLAMSDDYEAVEVRLLAR